jgi:hypothetical protein
VSDPLNPPMTFGRAMRDHWLLDPEYTSAPFGRI